MNNKKIPKEELNKIEKTYFIYRSLWIIAILWIFTLSFMNIWNLNEEESEAIEADKIITIPKKEQSSFIDLTSEDIQRQYNEATESLTYYKNKIKININELWNNINPFRPVKGTQVQ